MSFYTELRAGVVDIASALKSSTLTVTRLTTSLQDPTAEFAVDADAESDVYTLDAVVIGVEAEYIDNNLVHADDLQIIVSAYATKESVSALFEPAITDEYSIGGQVHRCVKIERIPADGTATCFLIFVKS